MLTYLVYLYKIKIQDLRESKSTIVKEVKMAQQELDSSYSDGGVSPEFHEVCTYLRFFR